MNGGGGVRLVQILMLKQACGVPSGRVLQEELGWRVPPRHAWANVCLRLEGLVGPASRVIKKKKMFWLGVAKLS